MIKPNTVFVIGAGASYEANLPLGGALKTQISELTHLALSDIDAIYHSENPLFNKLRTLPIFSEDPNLLVRAFRQLSAGVPFLASIDSFLEVHKGDKHLQICAKAAISHEILRAEASSKLRTLGAEKFNPFEGAQLDDTWYLELAYMLFEKTTRDSFKKAFEPVSFVVFNYDRCVEWFLHRAIKGLYFLTDEGAEQALQSLKIVHPYGNVGETKWKSPDGPQFGDNALRWCLHGAERLNTFSEGCETSRMEAAHKWIQSARTIVFLGLSFHPENLALLKPEGASDVSRIIGTRRGISDSAYADIKNQLRNMYAHSGKAAVDVNLIDMRCVDFLRQERRSIVAI